MSFSNKELKSLILEQFQRSVKEATNGNIASPQQAAQTSQQSAQPQQPAQDKTQEQLETLKKVQTALSAIKLPSELATTLRQLDANFLANLGSNQGKVSIKVADLLKDPTKVISNVINSIYSTAITNAQKQEPAKPLKEDVLDDYGNTVVEMLTPEDIGEENPAVMVEEDLNPFKSGSSDEEEAARRLEKHHKKHDKKHMPSLTIGGKTYSEPEKLDPRKLMKEIKEWKELSIERLKEGRYEAALAAKNLAEKKEKEFFSLTRSS